MYLSLILVLIVGYFTITNNALGEKEHVHIKIHIPKVVKHQHHTKVLLVDKEDGTIYDAGTYNSKNQLVLKDQKLDQKKPPQKKEPLKFEQTRTKKSCKHCKKHKKHRKHKRPRKHKKHHKKCKKNKKKGGISQAYYAPQLDETASSVTSVEENPAEVENVESEPYELITNGYQVREHIPVDYTTVGYNHNDNYYPSQKPQVNYINTGNQNDYEEAEDLQEYPEEDEAAQSQNYADYKDSSIEESKRYGKRIFFPIKSLSVLH